ncbi:MAG: CBS domain-containing protein [Cyanobacteria bacterium P01_D01_bin.105]
MTFNKPATAAQIMSSPVRTVEPTATIEAAQRLLLRYGHSGLCVVDRDRTLIGVISRRDIETSLRHGLGKSAVSSFMSRDVKTVTPMALITQVQHLMLTYDLGRIPVLNTDADKPIGIITRTDLLRFMYSAGIKAPQTDAPKNLSITSPPSCEALCHQLSTRLPEAWPTLMQLAGITEQKGWSLYVVGGVVRDLLIGLLDPKAITEVADNFSLNDIDLVVEGSDKGAGVSLAQDFQTSHPRVSLQVHGQFQTASLTWGTQADEPLTIDIATARTEFYPYPAANPNVEASSIHQDLYRRDFTINAMAICLSESKHSATARFQRGQLIDFFGGWTDLQKHRIKILHNNSLIEDPTRIFRAVRFAARLNFEIEHETVRLIQYAIDSGIYDQVRSGHEKTPALQSRLTAELKYLLSEPTWESALMQAAQLGALSCIHRDLKLTPALQRQLRRMHRWLTKLQSKAFVNKFDVRPIANNLPKWLMLLELVIAQLDVSLREPIATTLNLDAPSRQRLQNLHRWETDITQQISQTKRPSQLFSLLQSYELPELLLISDRHPYTLGPKIWQYIMRLANQPPLITGHHLKRMGYKPSPQFRKILTDVNHLALDGALTSVPEAEAHVLATYPHPPK